MILAQMGWGASDLVEQGLKDRTIAGAVLSPRSTTYTDLPARAKELHKSLGGNGLLLFDPQFYALTMPGADLHRLQNYPYLSRGLTRLSFPPEKVTSHAEAVIKFQTALAVDRWLSPTVLFSAFNDSWSQIAVSLGQASVAARDSSGGGKKTPLLVSLVFDEQALRDRASMLEFLDSVSTLETHGFYIIVRRSDSDYPALFDEGALANLLYMTYVLGEVHHFEVVHGYTDLVGPVLISAGATAICTGWHQSLRQFGPKQFMPSEGGRPPRPRYTSRQLANSIFLNPELGSIHSKGLLSAALSGTRYDTALKTGPAGAQWPRRDSFLHHWCALADMVGAIPRKDPIKKRLAAIENSVNSSEAVYDTLSKANVIFRLTSGPRNLPCWRNALKAFRADAKL